MDERLKIYAKTIEEEALKQIQTMSESEAYKDCKIRIMPDCHAGTGCTIGTVIELKDKVVPNTVGVDIGCGVLVVPLHCKDIDLKKLDEVINEYIPSGFAYHNEAIIKDKDLSGLLCKDNVDIDLAQKQIGTLCGGNHFIEVDEDEDGYKYLVIHSGSRHLGVSVCKYYQELAYKKLKSKSRDKSEIIKQLKEEGRGKEIQSVLNSLKKQDIDKDLAYLEGEDFLNYLHDMIIVQKYASLNRLTIALRILRKMRLFYYEYETLETVHNYIEITDSNPILRKGAVSANFPQKLIIPINMRDGSLLCYGIGNKDWLNSAPHGAGRLMSRKKAMETISIDDFKKSMENVYSTSVCETTIDEAPMAYKPMQEIIDCIKDTVEIYKILKPIYNFKAK